jgi:hypothetical protein
MMERQRSRWWRVALLGLTLTALVALDASRATAQDSGGARLAKVSGRVEILPPGQQAAWVPATVGASLPVGAEIRAFPAGWAEIRLVDGSTVVLAENSRMVVTKLDVDERSGRRASVFHLVVGKVRVAIAKAAITLIRFRESDFAITTPTAVAAARGTEWSTMFVTDTSVVVHQDEVLCLDLTTGLLLPLDAFFEALRCARPRPVSQSYERIVHSTSFPDSWDIFRNLPDSRTPLKSITDPGAAQFGLPLTSFTGPLTPSNNTTRGPESLPDVSQTSSRQLR